MKNTIWRTCQKFTEYKEFYFTYMPSLPLALSLSTQGNLLAFKYPPRSFMHILV